MKQLKIIFILFLVLFLGYYFLPKKNMANVHHQELTNIRIGWQIPWATQGQLTQILKKTDLLKKYGLEGDFKGFSYGGPLNEAALAGEVDVLFTADQPAITLISKDPNWTIIGRLMYNRVVLYVPPRSPIKKIADLKGKTVAMPFGAAAQRMALLAEEEAGLDSQKDVHNINLGIYEQSDLVRDREASKWGNIDALVGFDPTPAIFEEKHLVRDLKIGKVVSVIVMSNKYISKHPQVPRQFLQVFQEAYKYYRVYPQQANKWFQEEAHLDISSQALNIAAKIEPNLNLNNKIYLNFTNQDYQILNQAEDFLYQQKMISKKINIKKYINLQYLP